MWEVCLMTALNIVTDWRAECHKMLHLIEPIPQSEQTADGSNGLEAVEDWDADESWWHKLPRGVQIYEIERYKDQWVLENRAPAELSAIESYALNRLAYANPHVAEALVHAPGDDVW